LTLSAISAHGPQPLIAAPGKCPLQAYRKQKIERPVQQQSCMVGFAYYCTADCCKDVADYFISGSG